MCLASYFISVSPPAAIRLCETESRVTHADVASQTCGGDADANRKYFRAAEDSEPDV